MLNRKIGSILRGKATRLQVMLATVLGGTLGFVPGFFLPGDLGGGFAQAPGLILLLLCLVLVANANLAIFGISTIVAKLLSLPLLGASYTLGTWLVDGPLQGLFRWLCNAQVTAWFGLEHYATTGGVVIGVAFGVLLGLVINRLLRAIRNRMASVEENSERYKKYASKWWVRFFGWVFLGKGKGKKKSWKEIAESNKLGLPIRVTGVVVAVLFVGGVFVFQQWFSTPILTENLKAALERGNGATVDIGSAALHLGAGEIRVGEFAMADSADLGRDLLAADELVMIVDTGELLRRRLVIDEIKSVNARAGTRRATPGVVIPPAEPEPEPAPPPEGVPTIEDYLEQYEVWKARLEQAREWIEVVFAEGEESGEPKTPEEIEQERRRQLEEVGAAGVIASHLFDEGPRVLIRRVDIEGITWTRDGVEERIALRLRNLSSDPGLLAEPPTLALGTASESFALDLTGPSAAGAGVGVNLAMKGLSVDELFSGLSISGERPVRGGTIDLTVGGSLSSAPGETMKMNLPLAAVLNGATFAIGGRQTAIERLALPVGLRGPVTRPAVYLDDRTLARALLEAGKQELATFVEQNAGKLLGQLPGELQESLGGIVDPAKSPAEIVDAAKQKLEEEKDKAGKELETKAKEELQKGVEKVLPGGLGGLLGGKKKGDKDEED